MSVAQGKDQNVHPIMLSVGCNPIPELLCMIHKIYSICTIKNMNNAEAFVLELGPLIPEKCS